jgi:hypothetical protein
MYAKAKQGGGEGLQYAASSILFLSRAQLKEGDDKNGIIVTATTDKNRFARPHSIKFHIHYTKGMNPYIGLHEYLSWENCGIEQGKIISEDDFLKLKNKYPKEDSLFDLIEKTKYTLNNINYYFVSADYMKSLKLSGLKKFAIKHLATEIEAEELFNEKIFTEDVLHQLDENVITRKFSYGVSNTDSFAGIFDSDVETTELSDLEE